MGWFSVLILGIIAAVIAKLILRQRVGWFLTIVLGVIGALLGGWISQLFFGQNLLDANGFWSLVSWFWAVVGALIVLAIFGALSGRRR
ncbi:GlsB/YeaQ/YmgE family stress response membrane protein [Antiquaquibacter soli]|uniref:GlsB/YeaQ/YmgE family stress response membrane protein n=1 Tax=Antiquaquibacter soli TaxID=3064523 RepID=A0ABT9BRF9_9MICO|nr:GlsB/YeaQ/YmgE family stress response membrane protein [Protaetiibacter sp. WY-16]MDO7881907.1 GlsB/YeaQ/YmgE family stress response membrane protein [Protaetiibacter sp. WY-16]